MTHEEDRLVLRHSGSSNRGRGQPELEGILVVQDERLLGLFTSTSRAKSRGNAVFQGFAIISGDRGIQPLTCCFLTPSAPAACGTSLHVLNGKCCQLNPNAVSRAFIKPTYQVGIKTTCILWSNAVSPPIAPKSLLVSSCPALVLDMLITSVLLMPWCHCRILLSSEHQTPTVQSLTHTLYAKSLPAVGLCGSGSAASGHAQMTTALWRPSVVSATVS